MGLHGGINILHQKKWHVYNADNRAIVQRDEEDNERRERAKSRVSQNMALSRTLKKLGHVRSTEDTRIEREHRDFKDDLKVVHKPLDDADRYERLLKKKLRGDEADTRNFADVERYQRERGGASNRWLDKGAQKTYDRDHDKNNINEVIKGENDELLSKSGHINLFEDVERSRIKRTREHEQYLKDVGHDNAKDTCSFTDAKSKQEMAWYLKQSDERRDIVSFQRRGRRPLSDEKEFYRKSKKYWLNKEEEEAERIRQQKIKQTINRVGHNASSTSFGGLILGSLTIGESDEQHEKFEIASKEVVMKSDNTSNSNRFDNRGAESSLLGSQPRQYSRSRMEKVGLLSFDNDRHDNSADTKVKTRRWRDRDEINPPTRNKIKEVPPPTTDTVIVKSKSISVKVPPCAPEGHDGWIDDTPIKHGPKSTVEIEWPRLLPRDSNYMDKGKYRSKSVKTRRGYLESSSSEEEEGK